MTQSRIGVKLLGLCVFVLGSMAFSTNVAQGATWRVNGSNVTTLLPEISLTEIEKLLGILGDESKHFTVTATSAGGTQIELLCTAISLVNFKLGASGSMDLGKGTLHGCILKLNGVTSSPCLPKTPSGANDLVEISDIGGSISLHNSEPLVDLTVLVSAQLGEECAIAPEFVIAGHLVLRDSGGKAGFEVEAIEHLFEPGPLTQLTMFGFNATLKGSLKLRLAGASHLGLKWSGQP